MKKSEIIRQLEDTIRSTKRRIEDMIQDGETDHLDQEIEIYYQAQYTWLQEAQGMSPSQASATLDSMNVRGCWAIWAKMRPAPYPQSVLSFYNVT